MTSPLAEFVLLCEPFFSVQRPTTRTRRPRQSDESDGIFKHFGEIKVYVNGNPPKRSLSSQFGAQGRRRRKPPHVASGARGLQASAPSLRLNQILARN